MFSCAEAECGRVRGTAAATVRAIDGLADPTFRNRWVGPLLRSVAMREVYAAVLVGVLALEAMVRRRRGRLARAADLAASMASARPHGS